MHESGEREWIHAIIRLTTSFGGVPGTMAGVEQLVVRMTIILFGSGASIIAMKEPNPYKFFFKYIFLYF